MNNQQEKLEKRNMKKTTFSLLFLCMLGAAPLAAQTPLLDSWIRNTTGLTASYWENSNGNPTNPSFVFHTTTDSANVLSVCYDNSKVYIRSEGMTTDMGQFLNPGAPSAQGYTFSFTKTPSAAASPVAVPTVFTIGVLINGLPAFGNSDATSWNNQSQTNSQQGQHIWNVDAWYGEGFTLDTAFSGHPQQDGAYHSHATPHRLYDFPSSSHSPIVGFAFDGYPIYGPYGYTNGTSGTVSRMESSYQLRSITQRHSLADGTVLTANNYGPNVSTSHPLGEYIEDYEYVSGLGDLDENNGRTCNTPEYPNGTYAYFITADANDAPAYPYYLGVAYHGVLDTANLNPNSSVTIPSNVTCLSGATALTAAPEATDLAAYPSIVDARFTLEWGNTKVERLFVMDTQGRMLEDVRQPKTDKIQFQTSQWPNGVYNCVLVANNKNNPIKVVVQH
jgi:hypothetical protein